jgi:hypothetical protein
MFRQQKEAISTQLIDIKHVEDQIELFKQITKLPKRAFVSLAVDAIAMNPDRSYLPTKNSDYTFVVFVQPLDRNFRCFPLHIRQKLGSGNATPDIRAAVDEVRKALEKHLVVVKYKCADGDKGHNEAHAKFFKEWHEVFESSKDGLEAAVSYVSAARNVPVGDFLHIWKN